MHPEQDVVILRRPPRIIVEMQVSFDDPRQLSENLPPVQLPLAESNSTPRQIIRT